jgi:hypothetical protein
MAFADGIRPPNLPNNTEPDDENGAKRMKMFSRRSNKAG